MGHCTSASAEHDVCSRCGKTLNLCDGVLVVPCAPQGLLPAILNPGHRQLAVLANFPQVFHLVKAAFCGQVLYNACMIPRHSHCYTHRVSANISKSLSTKKQEQNVNLSRELETQSFLFKEECSTPV